MARYDYILIWLGLRWLFSVIWNRVDKTHSKEIENYKKRIEKLIEERDKYKEDAYAWERDCRILQETGYNNRDNENIVNKSKISDIGGKLNILYEKEKWNQEDVAEFQKLWKEKFWDKWINTTSLEFYEIRRNHTRVSKNDMKKHD